MASAGTPNPAPPFSIAPPNKGGARRCARDPETQSVDSSNEKLMQNEESRSTGVITQQYSEGNILEEEHENENQDSIRGSGAVIRATRDGGK
jgi:hypothetical protein